MGQQSSQRAARRPQAPGSETCGIEDESWMGVTHSTGHRRSPPQCHPPRLSCPLCSELNHRVQAPPCVWKSFVGTYPVSSLHPLSGAHRQTDKWVGAASVPSGNAPAVLFQKPTAETMAFTGVLPIWAPKCLVLIWTLGCCALSGVSLKDGLAPCCSLC